MILSTQYMQLFLVMYWLCLCVWWFQEEDAEGGISQTLKELRNFTLAPPLPDFKVRHMVLAFTAINYCGYITKQEHTGLVLGLLVLLFLSITVWRLKHGSGIHCV